MPDLSAHSVAALHCRAMILALAVLAVSACISQPPSIEMPVADDGSAWVASCGPNDPWDKPGPAYRVFANTYYVGTCGIAAILVAGDQGHVLIDGGTQRGGRLIADNIASLGFDIRDIRILLHSHEHYDHVGGLAFLQRQSNARVIASVRAEPVLRTGIVAANDPQSGMHAAFAAVPVAATVSHGEQLTLGQITLTAFETPGHSPGALSWTWTSCAAGECKAMAYLDSLSPVSRDTYRFADHPQYLARYRDGLAALTDIDCDFALTPHPVASAMHQRLASPVGLEDKRGCQNYVDRISARLEARLLKER